MHACSICFFSFWIVSCELRQRYLPTSVISLGDGKPERNALWNLPGDGVLRKSAAGRLWSASCAAGCAASCLLHKSAGSAEETGGLAGARAFEGASRRYEP